MFHKIELNVASTHSSERSKRANFRRNQMHNFMTPPTILSVVPSVKPGVLDIFPKGRPLTFLENVLNYGILVLL